MTRRSKMFRRRLGGRLRNVVGIALCGLISAAIPAAGAGFLIFEQGTQAMGMAGAFTAQANDGSALFHNVGGLAFLDNRLDVGVTFVSPDSEFQGIEPFPGSTAVGEQESSIFYPPHLYFVRKLNDRLRFGIGLNAPFGLTTEWSDRESFAGRFISTEAELKAFDLNPSIGYQVSDRLGVGFGIVARLSEVSLQRFIPQLDPSSFTVVDVATIDLESDFDVGVGWNVGLLYKAGKYLSFGLSYRSKIEIDYSGDGEFTQIPTGNPQLDALVATVLPFGTALPIETTVEFPDLASFGVALGLTRSILAEIDVNWVGWSSFDTVVIDFPTASTFTSVIPNDWDDVYSYRLGIRVGTGPRQWRFGYLFDESPQPDESVGPLLPDADRNDYTIGYGTPRYDVALMYVDFDSRTTTTNRDNFFGTYNTDVWLLGVTLKF